VDEHGNVALRKQLRRDQMTTFFVNLPRCLIGMEACRSVHHWARTLQGFGHTVRLMSPQFVKPYVKSNKNDVADAEASCEAVTRPSMRLLPVKRVEQQAVLSLRRARQGFVIARTAQANQIRSLLGEFRLGHPEGHLSRCQASPRAARRREQPATRDVPSPHRSPDRAPQGARQARPRVRGPDQGLASQL
jgi:transposase